MNKQRNNNKKKYLSKMIDLQMPPAGKVQRMPVSEALALGHNAFSASRQKLAENIFEQVIKAVPKLSRPYLAMAEVQLIATHYDKVHELLEKAIQLEPRSINVLISASNIYAKFNELEKASELSQKAAKLAPSNIHVLSHLGTTAMEAGDKKKAVKYFTEVLKRDKYNIGTYWNLAITDISAISEKLADQMKVVLNSGKLSEQEQSVLGFAIARYYQHQKNRELEFDYLRPANALRAKLTPWPYEQEKKDSQQIKALFTAEFAAMLRTKSPSEDSPIILASMPRSGSTLVEQIVASHSSVTACGEGVVLHGPVLQASIQLFGEPFYWRQQFTETRAADYLAAIDREVQSRLAILGVKTPRYVDKTIQNYSSLGVILSAYPQAKVLHCRRHPLDIALSCYQLQFPGGVKQSYSLRDIARSYLLFVELMDHWKQLFPDNILSIDYEDIVENQEQKTREILAFCDLEWEEQCLSFFQQDNVIKTASFDQVRQPVYSRSVGRWKSYAKYLTEAADVLGIDITTT